VLQPHRIILIAFLLFCAQASFATAVRQRDFPELVSRAEQIVIGTVLEVRDDKDTEGIARTLVTVGDLTVLKGTVSGDELVLDFAGGASGRYASRILDVPIFRTGERAVLFVAQNGRAVCPLVGIWQGRFRVQFDAARGVETVSADNEHPLIGIEERRLKFSQRSNQQKAITLDRFREMIADELVRPAGDR